MCVLKQRKKYCFLMGVGFQILRSVDGLGHPTFVHFLNSLRNCTSKHFQMIVNSREIQGQKSELFWMAFF